MYVDLGELGALTYMYKYTRLCGEVVEFLQGMFPFDFAQGKLAQDDRVGCVLVESMLSSLSVQLGKSYLDREDRVWNKYNTYLLWRGRRLLGAPPCR